jgi:O-acetyl-ADP-ribose deacetylase (regulator of RNase III)
MVTQTDGFVVVTVFPIPARTGNGGLRRPQEVAATEYSTFRLAPVPSGAKDAKIGIVTGRMIKVEKIDVWVNPENTDMEMARHNDHSISGIIRYWGAERDSAGAVTKDVIADELTEVVGSGRSVAPGSAFVTGAGQLAGSNGVRHIVHVAAVQGTPGVGFRQVRDVGLCVANALAKAEDLAAAEPGVTSVLFPLLGAGTGSGAVEATAEALLAAAISHFDSRPFTALREVYFLAYTDVEFEVLMDCFRGTSRLALVNSTV